MAKSRALTGMLCAVFFLTLVSSVRADGVRSSNMFLEKLLYAERHGLTEIDTESAAIGYLYAGHFENNNGKHLGFSVAAISQAPKLGIVQQQTPASVSQNPEPTAMVLLGTGLAAIAAFARKRRQ